MSLVSSFKIRQAVQKIKVGGVIAYPTEAVFGLGCDPLNGDAVYRLLEIKKRGIEKGLILIASSLSQLEPYLLLNDSIIERVQKTWPGAVTWIIPAQSWVPEWLTGEHDSLAVRVTSHPVARYLCEENAGPIVSTSANTSGRPPAIKSWQVAKCLGTKDLFILPGRVGDLKQATPIFNILNQQQIR